MASRRCYIHPAILAGYAAGETIVTGTQRTAKTRAGLRPEEVAVMKFLRSRS